MTDIILGVLHMCIFPGGLFALAVGLLFKGLDRRVEARLQRRVGPPLIQPLLDIAKLLTKETLIPKTAVRSVFLAAPVVGFAGMAVCAAFIPVPGVFSGLYNMGDLLVLFYLLPIPAIAIMLGGSASSSPFGAMGFSREMLMMLAYETPLLMILLAVAMLVGKATGTGAEFSLLAIVDWQQNAGSLGLNPVMIPALLAYLIFLPGTLGRPSTSPKPRPKCWKVPCWNTAAPCWPCSRSAPPSRPSWSWAWAWPCSSPAPSPTSGSST